MQLQSQLDDIKAKASSTGEEKEKVQCGAEVGKTAGPLSPSARGKAGNMFGGVARYLRDKIVLIHKYLVMDCAA